VYLSFGLTAVSGRSNSVGRFTCGAVRCRVVCGATSEFRLDRVCVYSFEKRRERHPSRTGSGKRYFIGLAGVAWPRWLAPSFQGCREDASIKTDLITVPINCTCRLRRGARVERNKQKHPSLVVRFAEPKPEDFLREAAPSVEADVNPCTAGSGKVGARAVGGDSC